MGSNVQSDVERETGIDARGQPDALLAAAPAFRRGRRRRFVGHLDEGEPLWPAGPVARDLHRHKFAKRRECRSKICYGCAVSQIADV